VQDRRTDVVNQLRDNELQAAERRGLEERLRVLDDRLVTLEKELDLTGVQLANAPVRREAETQAPRRGGPSFPGRVNPNLATMATFFLLLPFAIQLARRFFAPDRGKSARAVSAESVVLTDRIDRLESAVDAVAIEVERIGESQRFLTQAMMDGNARAGQVLGTGAPAFEGVPVRERDPAELR
jgi:hypothetical protein